MLRNIGIFSSGAASMAAANYFHQKFKSNNEIYDKNISENSKIPKMMIPFAPPGQNSFDITKTGFPSTINIITKPNFIISYDRQKRQPFWVMERILKEQISVTDVAKRSESNFYPEASVHKYFQSDNKDYTNSGFDRGHLAAAANHRHSQASMDSTFSLANVCPQASGLNRGIWSKLEQYCRALAQHNHAVYCISGPLYLSYLDTNLRTHPFWWHFGRPKMAFWKAENG